MKFSDELRFSYIKYRHFDKRTVENDPPLTLSQPVQPGVLGSFGQCSIAASVEGRTPSSKILPRPHLSL